MNWDAIGAIAELVGAAGVILSLVYLAAQIRQNTRSTNASAFHALNSSLTQMSATIASNRGTARLFRVGLTEFETLDADEVIQFFNILNFNFRHLESAYVQYRQGMRDEKNWLSWQSDVVAYAASPSVRQWWKLRRDAYEEGFRALVDSVLHPPETGSAD